MSWATPDLCDRFPDAHVAGPLFRRHGGAPRFHGLVATVRCSEDNPRVRELAATPGEGRVMVVDARRSGPRPRCSPRDGRKASRPWGAPTPAGGGWRIGSSSSCCWAIPAWRFAGISIAPGDGAYADGNGVVVATEKLA